MKQGQFKDPMVDFYQPFQSGEGTCFPIFPWNYYNTNKCGGKGGKKQKGGNSCQTPESYTNGMDCGNVKDVPTDMRKYFGPFSYPPTPYPMNPNCKGGKKGGNKKGGNALVGKQYLTQPLVPTTPSKPSDLQYNGSFSDTDSNWKQRLTGSGVPSEPQPLTKECIKNNLGVPWATSAGGSYAPYNTKSCGCTGGAKKKSAKKTKKTASKKKRTVSKKRSTSRRKTVKKGGDGMTYRGASECGQSSNMSDGPPFSPSWKYGCDTKKGGKKKASLGKKKTKKGKSKTPKRKLSKKKASKKGGAGSDFALTLASRGPANYPDMSEAQFRQFTKTGQYIPNSMLKYAAAPISTGYMKDPNPYPVGYNSNTCGGKNKKK